MNENFSPTLHYFDDDIAPESDIMLKMAIAQGYVPSTCLLAGQVVMSEIQNGKDACKGCNGPRNKCNGRFYDKRNMPDKPK